MHEARVRLQCVRKPPMSHALSQKAACGGKSHISTCTHKSKMSHEIGCYGCWEGELQDFSLVAGAVLHDPRARHLEHAVCSDRGGKAGGSTADTKVMALSGHQGGAVGWAQNLANVYGQRDVWGIKVLQ